MAEDKTLKERVVAVGLPEDAPKKDIEKAEKEAKKKADAEAKAEEQANKGGKGVHMCYVCGFKIAKKLPRSCPTCNVPLQPEKEATALKKKHDAWKSKNNL